MRGDIFRRVRPCVVYVKDHPKCERLHVDGRSDARMGHAIGEGPASKCVVVPDDRLDEIRIRSVPCARLAYPKKGKAVTLATFYLFIVGQRTISK